MRRPSAVALTHALLRPHDALPTISLASALAAQARAFADADNNEHIVTVSGFSTPAVWGLGGASLRLSFDSDAALAPGNSLLCIRARDTWLPALAASPGDLPDALGASRRGLAELMVLARPVAKMAHLTCLPDEVLRALFGDGEPAAVVPLLYLKPFAQGMSAGRWLEANLRASAGLDPSRPLDRLARSLPPDLFLPATNPQPPQTIWRHARRQRSLRTPRRSLAPSLPAFFGMIFLLIGQVWGSGRRSIALHASTAPASRSCSRAAGYEWTRAPSGRGRASPAHLSAARQQARMAAMREALVR